MNTNKRILLVFLSLLMVGIGFSFLMPKDKEVTNTDTTLRIGAGDDITGLLLKQIIQTSKEIVIDSINATGEDERILENFTFKDC